MRILPGEVSQPDGFSKGSGRALSGSLRLHAGAAREGGTGWCKRFFEAKRRNFPSFLWKEVPRRPVGIDTIFKKLFLFNWRIIALQYCDGFCHTST